MNVWNPRINGSDCVRVSIRINREPDPGENSSGFSVIIIIIIITTPTYNHSSASESESPWVSLANNDPSSAPIAADQNKIKIT
jgi:hypothetical protein